MFVQPAFPGAVVRDPETRRPLPEAGADVPENSFWLRRLQRGDVVLVPPPLVVVPADQTSDSKENA